MTLQFNANQNTAINLIVDNSGYPYNRVFIDDDMSPEDSMDEAVNYLKFMRKYFSKLYEILCEHEMQCLETFGQL